MSFHKLEQMRKAVIGRRANISKANISKANISREKIFYVCSFGGCGSKMLCTYLSQFGTVKHVHSRHPPNQLTHIGLNAKWCEWFSTIPVVDTELAKYYVIFIYRNPVKAIQSRFAQPDHLAHIQTNPAITLKDVVTKRQDLYGIENFFDNYTKTNPARNYKIYCVKYEELFTHMAEFNKALGLACAKSNYPVEKVKAKPITQEVLLLNDIYKPLLDKMRLMPFLKVV